ncbi:MAG: hypothetical protein M1827_006060 [Pycnora praestabilis]|nr:MAG: hypothetical protein M1827_006060 [Pycnora praestabilis]
MRPSLPSSSTSILTTTFLLPSLIAASTITCSSLRVKGESFDLSALSGPHTVTTSEVHPPTVKNTTFTIDICAPLERTKNVPKGDECPLGTWVCGIERTTNPGEEKDEITGVYPIAGDYTLNHGGHLDPTWTRLKSSASHADSEKEGLRVEMQGGRYPFDLKLNREQRAVVEFLCDKERTGNEGSVAEERISMGKGEEGGAKRDGGNEDPSLQFVSYGPQDDIDVLRLEWRTKYACEGHKDDGGDEGSKSPSGHWGFFTWFIIIAFLAIAAYLIFGSWLNYNRYGARGWDLLPHGDTIRDIPYLFKDWMRRVINTVQGGGSRGGYSAV